MHALNKHTTHREFFRQAETLIQEGKHQQAIELLEGWIVANPGYGQSDGFLLLSRALLQAGRREEGCRAALRVVDCTPSFSAWNRAQQIVNSCGMKAHPAIRKHLKVAVSSTWTTSMFLPLLGLAAARVGIWLEIYESPFNHYFLDAFNANSSLYAFQPDIVVLAPDTRALDVPTYADDPETVVSNEVGRWSALWKIIREFSPTGIVQHGFALPHSGSLGHLSATLPGSWYSMTRRINQELAELAGREDVGYVDADRLAGSVGHELWFDDRNWYLAKVPVTPSALTVLAKHTAIVMAARFGLTRRCLVVDLDNTLWGGVIGDDGLGNLELGNGPRGEAFVDFQRSIRALKETGVILAVCSKNDEAVAREPFENHSGMVLGLEDFAAFVANWNPKSENLKRIAQTLDIGIDALTFADDNPYEREQVRAALPQVDIIDLPDDPARFSSALSNYPYFELGVFTENDRRRTEQYRGKAIAESLKHEGMSLAEYQASLQMEAMIGRVDEGTITRVVQLINKTNQFNVTTIRRDKAELQSLLGTPSVHNFWIHLKDRFADHGLIAVIVAQKEFDSLVIDTLLMSCRVLGRRVEEVILDELLNICTDYGYVNLIGRYIPTARNGLVKDLYQKLGFELIEASDGGDTLWCLDVKAASPSNALITVRHATAG